MIQQSLKNDGLTDSKDVYNNVLIIHQAFINNAHEYRIKAKLPIEQIDTIAEDLARRSFMLKYKGLYIIPDMIVPSNVQEAINLYHKEKT